MILYSSLSNETKADIEEIILNGEYAQEAAENVRSQFNVLPQKIDRSGIQDGDVYDTEIAAIINEAIQTERSPLFAKLCRTIKILMPMQIFSAFGFGFFIIGLIMKIMFNTGAAHPRFQIPVLAAASAVLIFAGLASIAVFVLLAYLIPSLVPRICRSAKSGDILFCRFAKGGNFTIPVKMWETKNGGESYSTLFMELSLYIWNNRSSTKAKSFSELYSTFTALHFLAHSGAAAFKIQNVHDVCTEAAMYLEKLLVFFPESDEIRYYLSCYSLEDDNYEAARRFLAPVCCPNTYTRVQMQLLDFLERAAPLEVKS